MPSSRNYPRWRGDDLAVPRTHAQGRRTTPAGAGTTPAQPPTRRCRSNYPRWRRDDPCSHPGTALPRELPPLARGRPTPTPLPAPTAGTTPAGAGTTSPPRGTPRPRRNYPRWRGDDPHSPIPPEVYGELPPLARGRPSPTSPRPSNQPNYPRWRGDDGFVDLDALTNGELPPLARGRPHHRGGAQRLDRTTPAGAGTTCSRSRSTRSSANYPRWRGDDNSAGGPGPWTQELPPLARGRHRVGREEGAGEGTTPAGAGTTPACPGASSLSQSYPRWRGDDGREANRPASREELPPLARGRPSSSARDSRSRRATPAGAGTTWAASSAGVISWSYPRWRGDDAESLADGAPKVELPPLARGRPRSQISAAPPRRATPAGAGTTPESNRCTGARRSYPRWRGDDHRGPADRHHRRELPPLARGRHRDQLGGGPGRRATPAGAGTTYSSIRAASVGRSYPRWRGDDHSGAGGHCARSELPPLARGRLRSLSPCCGR